MSCNCGCNCGGYDCNGFSQPCYECITPAPVVPVTPDPCEGTPCDEIYNASCVIYNGPSLACYGIPNGSTLAYILEVIANNLP